MNQVILPTLGLLFNPFDSFEKEASSGGIDWSGLAGQVGDWAQANPELAGAAAGGLTGGLTGMFSGSDGETHMLRNALIGAGLGAGAGYGYRRLRPPGVGDVGARNYMDPTRQMWPRGEAAPSQPRQSEVAGAQTVLDGTALTPEEYSFMAAREAFGGPIPDVPQSSEFGEGALYSRPNPGLMGSHGIAMDRRADGLDQVRAILADKGATPIEITTARDIMRQTAKARPWMLNEGELRKWAPSQQHPNAPTFGGEFVDVVKNKTQPMRDWLNGEDPTLSPEQIEAQRAQDAQEMIRVRQKVQDMKRLREAFNPQ